jgi:hypothetical protein
MNNQTSFINDAALDAVIGGLDGWGYCANGPAGGPMTDGGMVPTYVPCNHSFADSLRDLMTAYKNGTLGKGK